MTTAGQPKTPTTATNALIILNSPCNITDSLLYLLGYHTGRLFAGDDIFDGGRDNAGARAGRDAHGQFLEDA